MTGEIITSEQQKVQLLAAIRAAIAQASDEQLEKSHPRILAERLSSSKLEITQIRNLENLAYTTDKISDITDFLKKQIGRDSKDKKWAKDKVGQEVIAAVELLRAKADQIINCLPEQCRGAIDSDLNRRVHLELCREFIKHLTAEFVYRKKRNDDE